MNKKRCEWCGKEFELKRYDQRFCCGKCRDKKKYEKNKEKIKARVRKYNKEHPEKVKAYKKKYYEKNKEKIKARVRKYNKEHPEKVKTSNKKWQKANLEQCKIDEHKRRTRKKGNGGSYTIEEIAKLRKKSKGICKGYNRKSHYVSEDKLTIDHIIPVSNGGTSNIDNIQLLCKSCNCSKGTN